MRLCRFAEFTRVMEARVDLCFTNWFNDAIRSPIQACEVAFSFIERNLAKILPSFILLKANTTQICQGYFEAAVVLF